ncbi:uncharacterized protein MKK02DRAFT_39999 [Dioszegia hungarica]|uniref:DUF6534 domain-containing protein n=1 Tax=Dioszegia hungarica TaxID=4972 RepID=A0AA38HGD6_9TREE|nr:uncharacterized protein MKK02DRAFT_39999 [Dioszegia hungarica]KAI9639678.1 hypothetical protein MKK02DRAFT_39999 [Dioszegia hungarica]
MLPSGGLFTQAALAMKRAEGDGSVLLPYMLGGVFDWILLGTILAMAIQWVQFRKEEKKFTIGCVVLSVISALGSSIYLLIWLTKSFVYGFGSYTELYKLHWASQYPMFWDWSTTAIQLFYVERAYRLNKNAIWIPLAIIPVMVVTWAFHIYSVVVTNAEYEVATKDVYNDPIAKGGLYLRSQHSSALYIDMLITSCIAYALYKHKTGWKATDSMIVRMIWVSLETQLPGLIVSILIIGSWGTRRFGIIFLVTQPKVYIVGFLAILNFRFSRRNDTSRQSRSPGPHIFTPESKRSAGARDDLDSPTDSKHRGEVRVDVETQVVLSPKEMGLVSPSRMNRGWAELPSLNQLEYDSHSQRTIGTGGSGFLAGSSDAELNDWAGKEKAGDVRAI